MTKEGTATAHTPAPWTIEDDGYERNIVAKTDATDVLLGSHTIIATCWQEDEADAVLIAAAPELLKACKSMMFDLCHIRDTKPEEYDAIVTPDFCNSWDLMRAAISKASPPLK